MTTRLTTTDEFLSRDSAALADTVLDPCPECGRKHPTPFKAIRHGRGLMREVAPIIEATVGFSPQRPVIIYDLAIAELVGRDVGRFLQAAWPALKPYGMLAEPGHLLDSGIDNGNEAARQIAEMRPDLLVAGGSGVICDLTKWIATQLNLPFALCGTAPSMNGYTSITATITENGVKVTEYLRPAEVVALDEDILDHAPSDMIRSGLGDLAAREVCNADWKLSNLVKETYFCSLPYRMMAKKSPDTPLAETVLLSGLSMTILDGETSPSSGAEHVISHFWDLQHVLRGLPKNFHGTQVGVGVVIMAHAYDLARRVDPGSIDPLAVLHSRPPLEQIEADCRARFGDHADSFIEVARQKRISDDALPGYIRSIQDRWGEIWQAIDPYLARPEAVEGPFRQAGVPMTLDAVQRTRAEALEALLFGNIYRQRYTLLDFLWELGLFPNMAEEIIAEAGV